MAISNFGAKVPKGRKLGRKFKNRRDYDEGVPVPSRKKSKEQEYRDAAGTGMALDAHMVDKEEGRLVKGRGDTNPKTRKKRRGKTKAKMGGGKIYASMDKKYGGGIYPKMGK